MLHEFDCMQRPIAHFKVQSCRNALCGVADTSAFLACTKDC